MLLLSTILFVRCTDPNESAVGTIDPVVKMNRSVLEDISNNVITKTYEDLNNKAVALQTAIIGLTVGDEVAFNSVKAAWRATRASWEQSESFVYGPVIDGIDPAIDSWHVDADSVNVILNLNLPISVDTIDANVNTRGFHVIEYLVWGSNGQKNASELTVKEIEYLNAAATDLQNNTLTLFNGWTSAGGDFASTFISAGNNTIYPLQKDAFLEITNGMIALSNEMSTTKILGPLDEGIIQEESWISGNTKQDLINNVRSIQNIYLGDFASVDSKGLTDLVAAKDSALDSEIKNQIEVTIASIEAIPDTFTQALTDNRPLIENIKVQVDLLHSKLETGLRPFFQQ